MQTVSVDIGSTWTKAALFAHEGEELTLVNHVLTPTTTHHLADGFFASLNQVLNVADARPLLKSGEVQLKYSPGKPCPDPNHHTSSGRRFFCQPESGAECCRCSPVTEKW